MSRTATKREVFSLDEGKAAIRHRPWKARQDHPSRSVRRRIDAMVRRIAQQFAPDQVILFGSHARGTAGPDSDDVDCLVVMRVSGSKRQQRIEIRRALRDFRIPKDIVVTTPEDFAWRKEIPGTIERAAATEGQVVYARP